MSLEATDRRSAPIARCVALVLASGCLSAPEAAPPPDAMVCADGFAAYTICEQAADDRCEVYFHEASPTSCDAVCATAGWRCLMAWDQDSDLGLGCTREGDSFCANEAIDTTCLCAPP
jgi:hypothetical protein